MVKRQCGSSNSGPGKTACRRSHLVRLSPPFGKQSVARLFEAAIKPEHVADPLLAHELEADAVNQAEAAAIAFLLNEGMNCLEILDVDVSTVVPAFAKEDLDGVYIWDPWAYRLQQRNGKQLVTDADVGIRMPALWIGREDWLANPEAGKRFVQAMQMAHELMGKDTEATAVLTGEVLGVDTDVARDLITRTGYPTVEEQADPDNVLSVHPDTIARGEGLARVLTDIAEFFESKGRVESVPDMTQKVDSGPVMLATGG